MKAERSWCHQVDETSTSGGRWGRPRRLETHMILLTPVLLSAVFPMTPGGDGLHAPQRLLEADGSPLTLPDPGYAAPAIRDLDGDGRGDLIIGLLEKGAFQVRRGLGELRFAEQRPLIPSDGTIVPGVW